MPAAVKIAKRLFDLHSERRTEVSRSQHDRRRRRVGSVAGQTARSGEPSRSTGLSRALSERLYLPLCPPQLGSAQASRRGVGARLAAGGREDGKVSVFPPPNGIQ